MLHSAFQKNLCKGLSCSILYAAGGILLGVMEMGRHIRQRHLGMVLLDVGNEPKALLLFVAGTGKFEGLAIMP